MSRVKMFVVVCLTLSISSFSTCKAVEQNAAEAPVDWTPVTMRASVTPQMFRGSDGLYNLAYEVVLNNWQPWPVAIKNFKITSPDGRTLKNWSGPTLQAVMAPISSKPTLELPAGGAAIIYVNLMFLKPEDVPSKVMHQVSVLARDFSNKPKTFTNMGLTIDVNKTPPLVISPPLRGGKWIVLGGYCGTLGHRRTLYPIGNKQVSAQRFAIDWCRLDNQNYSTKGNPNLNASSPAYNQPIYAVADGTVYGTVNRFGEQVPFKAVGTERYTYPAGNSITLDLGNGLYGMYAHIKPGTMKVKQGDRVKRGDIIAYTGNSGNSTGPHLHFHVTDDPHTLQANGVPYEFDKFQMVGQIADISKYLLTDFKGQKQSVIKTRHDGAHTNELPREGHILDFGN